MNKNSHRPKYQKSRKRIINTAIKLFVKYGIQGTSMATLANKAGVATGSIYNYFENKEALINEIFREICDDAVAAALKGGIPQGSVKERFDVLMRREILHKVKYQNHFLFMSLYAYSPIIMKEVQEGYRPDNHPMVDVFNDGREQGVIRPLPDNDLYYFIFGGLASWIRWKSFCKESIEDTDIDNLVDLTWGSIKCD